MHTVDVHIWPLIIDAKPLGPVPVDPGLIRIAAARDIQAGDLVVGYFDGCISGRWMWRAHQGEVCYRALPGRHPLYADVLTVNGLTYNVQGSDEYLIVPAALAPVTYAVGDRVERPEPHPYVIGTMTDRPGTVTAADADALTVAWDHLPEPETVQRATVRHVDVDEFVTLTVVARRGGGGEDDPCDAVLGEHPDVLFVGHQDGVTTTALALGAEPSAWS